MLQLPTSLLLLLLAAISPSSSRAGLVVPQPQQQYAFEFPLQADESVHSTKQATATDVEAGIHSEHVSRDLWAARLVAGLAHQTGEVRAVASNAKPYADDAVVRVSFDSDTPADQRRRLVEKLKSTNVDVWSTRLSHIDMRMHIEDARSLSASLSSFSVSYTVLANVSTLIQQEQENIERGNVQLYNALAADPTHFSKLLASPDIGLHSVYHSYASIESLLHLFATDYPDFARLEKIGQSAEGRNLWSLRISDYRNKGDKPSHHGPRSWRTLSYAARRKVQEITRTLRGPPRVVEKRYKRAARLFGKHKKKKKLGLALLAGQHAREWVAPATSLYIAHSILTIAASPSTTSTGRLPFRWLLRYTPFTSRKEMHVAEESREQVLTLLSDYEMHFIPVANPDGYEWSRSNDRLWQKSRQAHSKEDMGRDSLSNEAIQDCIGIDLNRNWEYKFVKPQRPNPCSDSYPGQDGFESKELQAISKYLRKLKNAKTSGLDVFMDFHSFGQMLMYPYSYSCETTPPDAENLYEALLRAGKAIKDVHLHRYEVGSSCDVSYVATGQSIDWAYHDLRTRWSFAANLRDQGVYAFLLPPNQIVESGQEMLAGLLDLARFVAQKEKIEPTSWL